MTICSYCGRENDEAFARCRECGTDLSPETTPVVEQEEPATPSFADYADVPGAFSFEEGFSRPNWRVIGKAIETLTDLENRRLAWDDAVLQWTTRLSKELGGGYKATKSGRCVLVSNLELEAAKRLLKFA